MCSKNLSRRDLLVQMLALGGASMLPGLAFGQNISHLTGTAWVNGRKANKFTKIFAGDSIVTGNNSSIVFVVDKDAYQLGSRSRLVLRSSFGIINTLRLLSGSLLAVFAPGNKTISTPTATAGIRGTGVFVDLEEKKNSTYFCTCYGKVELNSSMGMEMIYTDTIRHNARFVTETTGQDAVIETAPFINHTNQELIMLESLVGRKPPFVT